MQEVQEMRVTKSIEQVNAEKMTKERANAGCNVCPNCGETKEDWEYIVDEGNCTKGISMLGHRTQIRGIIFTQTYHIDCYQCGTCGVKWESEPYPVGVG